MAKKKEEPMMLTAQKFAEKMGVHYRTVLNWLNKGLIPGAEEKQTPMGNYWEIPLSALTMERPKPGPKPRKKAGN
jgi:predicted site-specific integrase-resolvase